MILSLARRCLLAAPFLLTACMNVPRLERADAAAPSFPLASFFTGRTEGNGTLIVMMHGSRSVRVSGVGHRAADGAIGLEQSVEEQGKPARTRRWSLHEVAPGRFAGTLSEAAGPVTGTASGNRLHLSFAMRGGMQADQWLTLAADGRSTHNILRVSKLGLTVATLDETIRKLD
jgi:Protein of unknown function (DUF3833)